MKISKILLLFCFFIGSSVTFVRAQEDDKMLGLRAGVNISTLALNQASKEAFRPGVNIGVYYIQPLDKQKVSLQIEAYFSQKGGYYVGTQRAGSAQLNYLELPVMVRFSHQIGNIYLYALAGPYISGLMGGMYQADTAKSNLQIQWKAGDVRFEYGMQAGGGIAYQLGKGRIFLDVRYVFGLTNINTADFTRNRVTTISVGYDIKFRELAGK